MTEDIRFLNDLQDRLSIQTDDLADFLFIDKRPFVRFHAMQSIIVFGGIHILHIVLSWVLFPALRLWSLLFAISGLISIVSMVLWILLMVKAYGNEWYKLPYVGDIALQKSQQQ